MDKAKLTLFVTGSSSRTTQAIENLKALCGASSIEFEIIDIMKHPEIAEQEKVFATPMLVRMSPLPRRRIVGDLADKEMIRTRLELCE